MNELDPHSSRVPQPQDGEREIVPLGAADPIDAARRDAILATLLAHGRARRRRRIATRASLAVLLLGLAGLVVVRSLAPETSSRDVAAPTNDEPTERQPPTAIEDPQAGATEKRRSPSFTFETIRSDGSSLERYAARSDPRILEKVAITDAEAVRLLRETGRPEGIVRIGGEAHLESEVLAFARDAR